MTEYYLTEEAIEEIESDFVQNYNTEYWYSKIYTMKRILEDADDFCDFLSFEFEDTDGRDEMVEELEMYATSELVYTFYHTSEALFALMMASQSRVPWLVLREYRSYQLWDLAEYILDIEDEEEQIDAVGARFYPTLPPNETLNNSCREIYQYLSKMFFHYQNNEVYNSYKHGLRLMADEEYMTVVDGETDEKKATLGGYAHIFLEDEEIDTDDGSIKQLISVTRAYDPDLYRGMAEANLELIEHILRIIEIQHENLEGELSVPSYPENSLTSVFETDSQSFFEFREPYDVGEHLIVVE